MPARQRNYYHHLGYQRQDHHNHQQACLDHHKRQDNLFSYDYEGF